MRFMRVVIALSLLAGLSASLVSAETASRSWRCAGKDIKLGDSKGKVLDSCGEPDYKDVVSGGAGATSEQTEQWYYKRHGEFRRILTFQGTKLTKILVTDE